MKHEEEAESINDLMGCLKNTPVVNIGGAPSAPQNPAGKVSPEVQKLADAGAEMAKTLERAVADVQRERDAGNKIWSMHEKEMGEYRSRAIDGLKKLASKVRDIGVAKNQVETCFETERARLEKELMAKGKQSTYFETELAAQKAAYEIIHGKLKIYETAGLGFVELMIQKHPGLLGRFTEAGPHYDPETHELNGKPLEGPMAQYSLVVFVLNELAKELDGLHATVKSLETAVETAANERDVLKTKAGALEAQDAVDEEYAAEQTAFLIAANDKAWKYLAELRNDKK